MIKFEKHDKKRAFSLAEALVVMLIVSIISLISIPVVTKKRSISSNALHGKWACKYDNDEWQGSGQNIDDSVSWTKKTCAFPAIPQSVKYLYVEVYGAGGGGSRGYALPWETYTHTYTLGEHVERDGQFSLDVTLDAGRIMGKQPSMSGNKHYYKEPDPWNPSNLDTLVGRWCPNGYADGVAFAYVDSEESWQYESCPGGGRCTSFDYGPKEMETVTIVETEKDEYGYDVEVTKEVEQEKPGRSGICAIDENSGAALSKPCVWRENAADEGGTIDYCYNNTHKNIPPDTNSPEVTWSSLVSDCENSDVYKNLTSDMVKEKSIYQAGSSEKYPRIKYKGYGCYNKAKFPNDPTPKASDYSHKLGVSGNYYLQEGDYIAIEYVARPKQSHHDAGKAGGYDYTESSDGYDVIIYRGNDGYRQDLYTLTGNEVGRFSNTRISTEDTYVDYLHNIKGYSNATSDKSAFYVHNGKAPVAWARSPLNPSPGDAYSLCGPSSSSCKGYSIYEERFVFYHGCAGQSATDAKTFYVSASKANNPTFHVGKGGAGAIGVLYDATHYDNRESEKAQPGEDTYFGNVRVKGGLPGIGTFNETGCSGTPASSANPYDSNSGKGGAGGGITNLITNPPKRNYSLSIENDSEPDGRWSINNGGSGTGGMIIVSW